MTIESLWSYVDGLSAADRAALADEGLFLHRPPKSGGYDSSPRDYLAFASTGGDGVHFSFPLGSVGAGPIIMTVPMAFEQPNVVVGEDLEEFLCLGSKFGYFSLEQLAYDFAGTSEAIQSADSQSPALASLSRRFELAPWPDVRTRLMELADALK